MLSASPVGVYAGMGGSTDACRAALRLDCNGLLPGLVFSAQAEAAIKGIEKWLLVHCPLQCAEHVRQLSFSCGGNIELGVVQQYAS